MKYFIDTEFLEGTQDIYIPFTNIKIGKTKPTIDLISIGIVAEDGRELYLISKDFNLKEAWNRYEWKTEEPLNPIKSRQKGRSESIAMEVIKRSIPFKSYWVRENVLKPIFDEWIKKDKHWTNKDVTLGNWKFTYKNFKYFLDKYGKTNKQIAEEVKEFVYQGHIIPKKIHDRPGVSLTAFEASFNPSNEFYSYYADYHWVVFCWLFGKMNDLPNGFPMYCIDLKQELDNYISVCKKLWGEKAINFNMLNHITTLPNYPTQTNEHNALSSAKWNKELYEFLNKLN